MSRARLALAGMLLGAAAVGSVATITVWGGSSTAAPPSRPPVAAATVVRTDLATTTLTQGTLGYLPTDPVVNRMSGTYTDVPAPGTTIRRGEVLYRVDNQPAVLMIGATPAWRPFGLGMTDGPDVLELEANLVALGDATGLFTTATTHFGSLTAQAVQRWQASQGFPADGQVAFGQVVFQPGPILVGAPSVAPGEPASPGSVPYQVTTANRIVSVPLTPNIPSAVIGERVSIVLLTNATTPGTITAIGPAPSGGSGSPGSSNAGMGSGGSDQSQVSAVLTVTPDQPAATGTGSGVAVQVALTVQSANNVLAVPIPALLALAGGGYGVEVVGTSGVHHLVGVTTGVFSGSEVQITGSGIEPGTRVVVAQ